MTVLQHLCPGWFANTVHFILFERAHFHKYLKKLKSRYSLYYVKNTVSRLGLASRNMWTLHNLKIQEATLQKKYKVTGEIHFNQIFYLIQHIFIITSICNQDTNQDILYWFFFSY